ncbi:hypothetical protein A3860_22255 [Niastella vici]|uniref:Uncharacterized protein n=1 Tax=Niastella vici TaxID=1703345 RepID=A0A1V9G0I6_9BACT|nr:hypothetical protein A3860_22255 [Niastella vici]
MQIRHYIFVNGRFVPVTGLLKKGPVINYTCANNHQYVYLLADVKKLNYFYCNYENAPIRTSEQAPGF